MHGLGCARDGYYGVQGLGCAKRRGANTPQEGHASDKVGFLSQVVLKKSFFYDNPLYRCSHFQYECLNLFL